MFKFNREPLKFNPPPKPEEAPEPEPKPAYTPLKTDSLEGEHLRITRLVNWTGNNLYQKDGPLWAPGTTSKRNEIITLGKLALEHMKDGQSAERIIQRLSATILSIDPNAKL